MSRRLPEPAVAVAVLALGIVVSWLRLPVVTRSSLWAEDGWIFLDEALNQGWGALFSPYGGYLHLLPRLVSSVVVATVPVSAWAVAMALGACVVTAGVAALVFVCARDVVAGVWPRLGLAAATLLVPLAPREVLGNTANLHWYCLWLVPWLLLYTPRTRLGGLLLAVPALLVALTEIQAVVFLPLLAIRWRERRAWPLRIAFAVGMAAQWTTTLLHHRRQHAGPAIDTASTLYGYLINAGMTIWLPGARAIGGVLLAVGPVAAVACILPFVAAAAWTAAFGSRMQRVTVAALLVVSVALWVVDVHTTPIAWYDYAHLSRSALADPWLARYGVVPSLCLLATGIVALSVRRPVRSRAGAPSTGVRARGLRRGVATGLLLAVAVVAAVQFVPTSTRRDRGPVFAPQVAALETACADGTAPAHPLLVGAPNSPGGVHISCAQLERLAPPSRPSR